MTFRYRGLRSLGIVNYSLSLKQNLVDFDVSSTSSIYTKDVFYGRTNGSNHWCSNSGIGDWLLVSFNGIKPIVTHVLIKSHMNSGYFLKSWKLIGYNDESNCDDLFSISDSDDLAYWKEKVYKVNNPLMKAYSFFKFVSTGRTNKDVYMRVTRVDFYGKLYNIPNYCTPFGNKKNSFSFVLMINLLLSIR